MNDGLGGCGSGGWTLVMKIDGNQVTAGNISDLCLNIESPAKQIYVYVYYYYYYYLFHSQPFTTIPVFGLTTKPSTLQEGRLDST